MINLDRADLLTLIKSIELKDLDITDTLITDNADIYNGITKKWVWNYMKLNKLSDEDLINLYNLCKK